MSLLYIVTTILFVNRASSLVSTAISKTLKDIPEDGILTFLQMSSKYGHPAEEHQVITEDGYILTLHHIPGNKTRPVLMCHGVFDSADGWILRGKTSLAIILAEAGYDVWLLNQRGSRYSRKHVTLDPDTDAKFWDYSAHEFGYYDLAATIDYVLNATGQSKLNVIGFSEGTTAGFILTSTKPEYNNKINIYICLAPIAYLHNAIGPLKVLIVLGSFLNGIIPSFINEIAGYQSLTKAVINLVCTQLAIGYDFCFGGIMNPLIGPDLDAIEQSFFNVIVGHFPAGTSKKNLLHFSQIGMQGSFANYDHGGMKNMKIYGSLTPPVYDLNKVTMPVCLISGRNDRVSTLADSQILHDKLPNIVAWKILDNPLYNHLDHLWAVDAHKVVYKYVLETLSKYELV